MNTNEWWAFFVFLCLSSANVQTIAEVVKCSTSNSTTMKVIFDSYQNQTGLWSHTIGLVNHGLPRGQTFDRSTGPWAVDMNYRPVNCDEENKDTLSILITFAVRPPRNPDYTYFHGIGYYKLSTVVGTWAVAKENCEKDGAHLAIVNSQREADALKRVAANAQDDFVYVGILKTDPKGDFHTIYGDSINSTGFSQWAAGVNPANSAATHVGIFHKTQGKFSYSAVSSNRMGLCEQDL